MELKIMGIPNAEVVRVFTASPVDSRPEQQGFSPPGVLDAVKDYVENGEVWV